MEGRMKLGGVFEFTCHDGKLPYGNIKWQEQAHNVVCNGFMTAALNILFNGSGQSTEFYIGMMELTGSVTTSDTMASHAGWLRCNCYNGNQKLWNTAEATGRTITNSASKAQFVMNGTSTIWGGFIDSQLNKASTTGTLVAVAQFTGVSRSVASGDTVEVTYTLNMDDDAA